MLSVENIDLKSRRISIVNLCFAIVILFLTSCKEDKIEKRYKIGFSQCTGAGNWRKATMDGLKRELSFHPGTKLLYRNAEDNSDLQVKQIKELINQDIDILILSPNEAQPLTSVVEEAYNKGIPVVIIDRQIASDKYTSFIGADNYEIGKIAGNYVASLLDTNSNLIEIIGLRGSTPSSERHRGFADGIRTNASGKIGKQVYGNWLRDQSSKALYQIKDELSSHDIVFAQNDPMAMGAYDVYKKMGTERTARFIGVDGLPGPEGGIQLVSDKILMATFLNPTCAEESIQIAFKILEKKPFNKENFLPTVVIDSSNVRIMKLQTDKINIQQADIERQQNVLLEQQRIYNSQRTLLYMAIAGFILVVILGSIIFYSLRNNRKINRRLALQNHEILEQRNQLIEMTSKAKEATEAKFNFFTNVSHEFRTPLTLILGPLEDVLSTAKVQPVIKSHLTLVRKNVIRLLRLVNQLMDFRKIEHSKMKLKASENDLVEFLTEITNAFSEIADKKSITFRLNTKLKGLNVWFDVNMLDKVIFNLLSNAFKFTHEHGLITVSLDKNSEKNMAVIKVSDTGVGMTPDAIEHAFELFYQGHETSVKGSGLGLALSKELINIHHGSICLESEKLKGSTFEIYLPLGKDHLEADEIVQATEPFSITYEDIKIYTSDIEPGVLFPQEASTVTKEQSILIIEDNADLRAFLKYRLDNTYEIHEADDGNAGLNSAYEIVPDLIICDIILPGKDGMHITDILKNDIRTSHIPIILLTAKGSIEQQIEGMKLKVDAFIVKPFNLQYLEETIKSLLKNRDVLREHYSSEFQIEQRAASTNKIDKKFLNELRQ